MRIENLRDLYVEQLTELRYVERRLNERLPELAGGASEEDLRTMLERESGVTDSQVRKLEDLVDAVDGSSRSPQTAREGIDGLVSELEKLTEKCDTTEARDAALIAGLQRIKHYEIAGYGTARAYARRLGETEAVDRLSEILDEESGEDEKLTRLATETINRQAVEATA